MSTDDEDSELYDTTNHIIAAVQNHETRLIRLEDTQKQLDVHLEKLAKALVLDIKSQDIFMICMLRKHMQIGYLNTSRKLILDFLHF